jgi:hypothetical protein
MSSCACNRQPEHKPQAHRTNSFRELNIHANHDNLYPRQFR